MPDSEKSRIGTADERTLVSLEVLLSDADEARSRLELAAPLQIAGQDPKSLWLGPDHWLLTSRLQPASAVIESCEAALDGLLFNAVDQSAAYAIARIEGEHAREVLASGSGLDFRRRSFPQGACRPTRLAQIAAVIAADGVDAFEIFVDRCYRRYLCDWLEDALLVAERAAGRTMTRAGYRPISNLVSIQTKESK